MDTKLLEQLSVITAEEQEILDGRRDIDRNIYMQGQGSIINSRKLRFCLEEKDYRKCRA